MDTTAQASRPSLTLDWPVDIVLSKLRTTSPYPASCLTAAGSILFLSTAITHLNTRCWIFSMRTGSRGLEELSLSTIPRGAQFMTSAGTSAVIPDSHASVHDPHCNSIALRRDCGGVHAS